MIFALCICIEKHRGVKNSLPTPLGYMSKGGIREGG